jgi:DedD protein
VERHVKERLIGAAVLMAAAIILIPEMLSGPRDVPPKSESATASGEAPLKTYTIDLTQPSPSSSSVAVDERAPPAERLPPTQSPVVASAEPDPRDPEPAPPSAAGIPAAKVEEPSARPQGQEHEAAISTSAQAASRPTEVATPPVREVERPELRQESPKPKAEPRPVASVAKLAQASSAGKGDWAVQIGSYSSQATADRLAADLRAKGFSAFVMPVKSGTNTLYRVRLGPMKDRENAAEVLRSVSAVQPGAAVVAHP